MFKKSFSISLCLLLTYCSSKSPQVDDLSYLKLRDSMKKKQVIESKRTKIMSVKNLGNKKIAVNIQFLQDKKIPKDSLPNFYAVRFVMHSSLFRSKTLGGGSFVLKMVKKGKGLKILNFKKSDTQAVRYPQYAVNDMDTLNDPQIITVKDLNTGKCVLLGCGSNLQPSHVNPRLYKMQIVFYNAFDEEWGFDHGYLNKPLQKDEEVSKILNISGTGVNIKFPHTKNYLMPKK